MWVTLLTVGIVGAGSQATQAASAQSLIVNVPSNASQVRYGAHDNAGHQLASLDAVSDPDGSGYIGVYHWPAGPASGDFHVTVGESNDLVNWTRGVDLDADGGNMPTIRRVGRRGFLVAFEDFTRGDTSQIRVRYYSSRARLMSNTWSEGRLIPRTLSRYNEGTPSFEAVQWRGALANSVIRLGFHYNSNADPGVDRQARGTLTDRRWRVARARGIDNILTGVGFPASHGKRSQFGYGGRTWRLYEAQRVKRNFNTWSFVLYDVRSGRARPLAVRGRRGVLPSIGVPSVKVLRDPDGAGNVLFVSGFVFENTVDGGALVYYQHL